MCEGKETCPTTGKPIAEAPCNKLGDDVSDRVTEITFSSQDSLENGKANKKGSFFKLNTDRNRSDTK